jgi:hypothetical protein
MVLPEIGIWGEFIQFQFALSEQLSQPRGAFVKSKGALRLLVAAATLTGGSSGWKKPI